MILGLLLNGDILPIIWVPFLAVADYVSRKNISQGKASFISERCVYRHDQSHEIQGVLALENGFNRLGFDHVILVKIASTAVATHLLGGTRRTNY